MKKFFILILSILYISTSTGASLYMHYCMGKMVDFSVFNSAKKDTCSKCGMKNDAKDNNNCCKHEHKQLKAHDNQKHSENLIEQMQSTGTALAVSYSELPHVYVPSAILDNPLSNAPPRSRKVNSYILNCTFRI